MTKSEHPIVPHGARADTPRHHLIQEILVALHSAGVGSDPETDDWATHPSSECLVEASLEGLGKVETML